MDLNCKLRTHLCFLESLIRGLGVSLQSPSLDVPFLSLLFSDLTWTFLLRHKGVTFLGPDFSHMLVPLYCCVHHNQLVLHSAVT